MKDDKTKKIEEETVSKKLNISQWAEDDRPREKMMAKGSGALSDAELLAILVGSGNTEETAVELMRRMMIDCGGNLNNLARWGVSEFSRYKGMGPAKSITIMAALELGRRRNLQQAEERIAIRSSHDIFDIFHPMMRDLPLEEFWILLLNQAGKVIEKIRISNGGIAGSLVDIRTVLREALLRYATQIAAIHNHPSGTRQPSMEDRNVTDRLRKACETMNIRLIDHVIVSESGYYSFADEGLI